MPTIKFDFKGCDTSHSIVEKLEKWSDSTCFDIYSDVFPSWESMQWGVLEFDECPQDIYESLIDFGFSEFV